MSVDPASFENIPFLRGLGRVDFVKLVAHFDVIHLQKGDVLFRKGDLGDSLFIVLDGAVAVSIPDGGQRRVLAHLGLHEVIGEMALLSGEPRSADVEATAPATLLRLRKERFDALVKSNLSFSLHLNRILSERLSHANSVLPAVALSEISPPAAAAPAPQGLKSTSVGGIRGGWLSWGLTTIVPAVIVLCGESMGLNSAASHFLAVFAAMVLMWIFALVDDYIPGLLVLLATLAMGIAPPSVVLSGFASDGFFMALSFLALGTVIVASGLSYRVLLLMLLRLPDRQFWRESALLFLGFFLTPMIPSANGRASMTAPFAIDMAEALRLQPQRGASTRIGVAAFTGAAMMSGIFLSSKSVNFIILGMLPAHVQSQFQFTGWLRASCVAAATMLLLHLAGVSLFLRSKERPVLSRERLQSQLGLLGSPSADEWGAVAAVVVFVAGILTASLHRVQPPWIGFAILCALLVVGSLSKKAFREKIDWPFLMYLAEMVGIIAVFNYLGLNRWVAGGLSRLGLDRFMVSDFWLFVLILAVIIFVIRLAVPISAAIVLLATLFMPLAESAGVNTWVIGFTILILGEMWFFPYQCSYYLQFREIAGKHRLYDEKLFLRYNLYANLIKLAAILASIPFWKRIGLL